MREAHPLQWLATRKNGVVRNVQLSLPWFIKCLKPGQSHTPFLKKNKKSVMRQYARTARRMSNSLKFLIVVRGITGPCAMVTNWADATAITLIVRDAID